jgi:hypothetical protein
MQKNNGTTYTLKIRGKRGNFLLKIKKNEKKKTRDKPKKKPKVGLVVEKKVAKNLLPHLHRKILKGVLI